MAAASKPTPSLAQAAASLEKALREWWKEEQNKWIDSFDEPADPDEDSDLWDDMPVVESKQIARTAMLFEEHLGTKLDVKLIRAGGYDSIDEAIADLVPKMVEKASKK